MEPKQSLFYIVSPFLPPIENTATNRFIALAKYLNKDNFVVKFANLGIYTLSDKKKVSASPMSTSGRNRLQLFKQTYLRIGINVKIINSLASNVNYFLRALIDTCWKNKTAGRSRNPNCGR